MTKVLVTGGGGFLGSAIVRRLVDEGTCVRSFSRRRYPELAALGVEQVAGDLSDTASVTDAVDGMDLVYHVAAKAGVWGAPEAFYRANVQGTANIIQACIQAGVPRLVFTSSPSVVFDGRDMEGADESVPYPVSYKSPYPETKAKSEQLVLEANGSRLATVALRPHLIWGPGDTHLVPGILARASSLKRIGKRNPLVDFTYIDNAAEAHLCAGQRLASDARCAGKAYFITQAEPMPLWDFVSRVLQCAGRPPITGTVPRGVAYLLGTVLEYAYRGLPLTGEPRLTRFLVEELSTAHWFDISSARRELGYAPQVSMDEGFRRLQLSLRSLENTSGELKER